MKCIMTIVVEGPNERGEFKRRCDRRGCRKKTAWTPDPPERIKFRCTGWPHRWEIGSWISLLLEAVGVKKQRWAQLRFRLGLDEVPKSDCPTCTARERWLNTFGGWCYTKANGGSRLAQVFVRWCMKTAG